MIQLMENYWYEKLKDIGPTTTYKSRPLKDLQNHEASF